MNRLGIFIIAVVILIFLLSSTIFIVDQRDYAIVFRMGQIQQVIQQPGLKMKLPAPIEQVVFLEKRIMTIDNPEPERFITAEKKNLLVDSFIKWKIIDPHQFYISFKGDIRFAAERLTQLNRSALNEEFTKRTISEVVSTEREKVTQTVRNKLAIDTEKNGIGIVDVRLRRVDLLAEISESVYLRMEAERKRVANELRSIGAAEAEEVRANADRQREEILAAAYREAQKIKGDGDARALGIYSQAFGRDPKFARFYQSLEVYRSAFKNKSDILVLDSRSEFFPALNQPESKK